jgi:hypothetical protein
MMNHYQPTDTLSLDPALAVSGAGGTSAPEQAAGNADYATWSWETVLATVLNIPISDRSEVTGQPWLTVAQAGQQVPGGHLIWTASWNTKPKSGGTSLQVYLNPALYLGGGAWDRFVNAPPQALSGAAGALPLVPQSFQTAQAALAAVTTGLYNVSTQLDLMHHNATGEDTPFHGNTATVITELFSDLHGTTQSMYDQLSNPSYSNAVGAAGDAARTFLSNVNSAYGAWSQLAEHSPLGAIVQVLTGIATPDGNGGFTIPDPQNTPFGDLTTPGAWAAVEQQAKNMWLGLLTGNSYEFNGLDVLGRSAVSTLAGQYTTTTQIVKPLVGPAPPPTTQTPVDGQPGADGGPPGGGGPAVPGGGPPARPELIAAPGGGPAGTGPAGNGPAGNGPAGAGPAGVGPAGVGPAGVGPAGVGPAGTGPTGNGPAPGGAPGNVGKPVLMAAGTTTPGAAGGPAPVVQRFAVPGGTTGGPGAMPGVIGLALTPPPATGQNAEPGAPAVSAGLDFASTAGVLAGAIGATPVRDGEPAGSADPSPEKSKGFTGTVGRGPKGKDRVSVPAAHGAHPASRTGAHAHIAPAAGFSLGGGPHGAVLSQAAVSTVAVKPPSITSSALNTQLTPTSTDGSGLPGLPGSPGGPPAASSMVLADSSPSAVTGGAMLGGPGVQGGANGTMMLPPGAQGGMGQRGQQSQERERLAYLPEDEDYWGTGPTLLSPGVDAIDDEADDEPDFDDSWLPGSGVSVVDEADDEPEYGGPGVIVGIGAEAAGSKRTTETISDWRMR